MYPEPRKSGTSLGQGLVAASGSWNAVPTHLFPDIETINLRERVQLVDAGNGVLHFEIMEAAGWQNESLVPALPGKFEAENVDIAKAQTKSPASLTQVLAGAVWAIWRVA